jgi:hypothetical protein
MAGQGCPVADLLQANCRPSPGSCCCLLQQHVVLPFQLFRAEEHVMLLSWPAAATSWMYKAEFQAATGWHVLPGQAVHRWQRWCSVWEDSAILSHTWCTAMCWQGTGSRKASSLASASAHSQCPTVPGNRALLHPVAADHAVPVLTGVTWFVR